MGAPVEVRSAQADSPVPFSWRPPGQRVAQRPAEQLAHRVGVLVKQLAVQCHPHLHLAVAWPQVGHVESPGQLDLGQRGPAGLGFWQEQQGYVRAVQGLAKVPFEELAQQGLEWQHPVGQQVLAAEDLDFVAHEDTSLALGVRIRGRAVLPDSLASSLMGSLARPVR
jgi:hypothetical protein